MHERSVLSCALLWLGFLNHLPVRQSITTHKYPIKNKLEKKMCSPWYRKTMILNHCPRGKPSASLDSIWNLARHIPIAYSPFFFSCGNRFLLIQPHNLIWFYSQCSIHLGSMVAGEQKEAGHGELTLPYACNPETPKRHHQFSLRFACIYFK